MKFVGDEFTKKYVVIEISGEEYDKLADLTDDDRKVIEKALHIFIKNIF